MILPTLKNTLFPYTTLFRSKKEITYAELIKNANKIGHTFLKAGLKKGDTVLVMSPRLIDTYEVYIAALKLGIIVSPAADMLRTSDLAYRIKNGDVKAVVVYHPFLDKFEKLRSEEHTSELQSRG